MFYFRNFSFLVLYVISIAQNCSLNFVVQIWVKLATASDIFFIQFKIRFFSTLTIFEYIMTEISVNCCINYVNALARTFFLLNLSNIFSMLVK